MAESVLDRIVAAVRQRLEKEPPPPDLDARAVAEASRRRRAGRRPFAAGLRSAKPAVIAECKKRSPSAGVLRSPFDPVELARAYQSAGAAAISVVTEPDFFGGDVRWLRDVRSTVHLPVLRKDFVVDRRQLEEAVVLGADAVLLIQRILEPDRLAELLDAAHELELEVLLEVFADEDPTPAIDSGAEVIGVNSRDLATFETRLDRAAEILSRLPADRVRVAESGIASRNEVEHLASAGADAFLVGEHLVRSADPGRALRELVAR